MKWHYQVVRHTYVFDEEEYEWYGIHEYYLSEEGNCWVEKPTLEAGTVDELKRLLILLEDSIYKYGVKDYNEL